MMILWNKIGSYFGSQPLSDNCYTGKQFNVLELSNGIYDEVKIDETLGSKNIVDKEIWSINTIFQWKALNNLSAGNIDMVQNLPIQYLLFERQEQGSLRWEQMCKVPYIKGTENYTLKDYFIKNNITYNFRFSPMTQNVIGVGISASVKTSYDRLFLSSTDMNVNCGYDLVVGDVTTVNNSTIIETLVGKYPVVLNSATKYRKGKISCTSLSTETLDSYGNISPSTIEAENVLNQKIEDFLTDGKPKLMRYNNLFIVVKIQNPTRVTDSNHSVFSIWEWSFDWIEVAENDLQSLLKNNLTYNVDSSTT